MCLCLSCNITCHRVTYHIDWCVFVAPTYVMLIYIHRHTGLPAKVIRDQFMADINEMEADEAGGGQAAAAFSAGQDIEARWAGGKHWYPGKVSKVKADGTLDVVYDDGDKEEGVAVSMVRPHKKEGKEQDPRFIEL